MNLPLTRRELLGIVAAMSGGILATASRAAEPEFRLATFSADVTPPIGHPLRASGGRRMIPSSFKFMLQVPAAT